MCVNISILILDLKKVIIMSNTIYDVIILTHVAVNKARPLQ